MTNIVLTPDRPEDDECQDFTLAEIETCCWVTVGNISVYILRTDSGVSVDLFAKGREADESLGGGWATFTEAENMIGEMEAEDET